MVFPLQRYRAPMVRNQMSIPRPRIFRPLAPHQSEVLAHSLLILLSAALLCLPCLLVGIPQGLDSEYHTAYQHYFDQQFWSGDLYPRWLVGLNKGYGSPIFLVQYPLPYFVTTLLHPITSFWPAATREAHALGIFCFLALAGAGLTARVWLRNHCAPKVATLGALLYICLPYIFGQSLYLRTALGELSVFIWMPLALAFCDKLRPTFTSVTTLGLVFALLLFSHVLTAVLFTPVLIAYAIVSLRSRGFSFPGCVFIVGMALMTGIGIAAIYVLPLAVYAHLFSLGHMQLFVSLLEFARYFPYSTSVDISRRFVAWDLALTFGLTLTAAVYLWRLRQNIVVRLLMCVTLGLGLILIVPNIGPKLITLSGFKVSSFVTPGGFSLRILFSGLFMVGLASVSYCCLSHLATARERLLLLVVCGAFILMLPWTAFVWKAIPPLANIQAPFRLSGLLAAPAVGLFGLAVEYCTHQRYKRTARPSLIVLLVTMAFVVLGGFATWRVGDKLFYADTTRSALARNVDVMYRSYIPSERVPAFANRLHMAADSIEVPVTKSEAGVHAEVAAGSGNVDIREAGPRKLHVSVTSSGQALVRIGQLYSPLWRAEPVAGPMIGRSAPVLQSSADGLIELWVGPGRREFELVFDTGWPERYGLMVSVVSILVVVGGLVFVTFSVRRRAVGGSPDQLEEVLAMASGGGNRKQPSQQVFDRRLL